MVVFRVTDNINIKTTDGTLIKYEKVKGPSNLLNETIYISTLEDFNDLKRVLASVGNKYKAKIIDESKVRYLSQFPRELGITNINEYNITNNLNYKYKNTNILTKNSNSVLESLYLNEEKADLQKQVEGVLKRDISIVILGNLGFSISEMICASTALRIFYEKLMKVFKSVKIDIYLNASENRFYTRDKTIFSNQTFINKVSALSIDVKEFCQYDFFIDASSVSKRSFYETLNHTDAWLYKLGIDYQTIPNEMKYNQINIAAYRPKKELEDKIKTIKKRGKVLLYHPYSANAQKSIPKEIAVRFLKKLIEKMPEYTFISALKLDSKFSHERYFDLNNDSSSFLDFCYIVSNATKILTVDTATYYIADAFFIPTVVIYTNRKKQTMEYNLSKAIFVKDESKNFSQFIFRDESLLLYRFDGWQKLKASKVIKLLEKL
ncbi:hypothetical protein [Halarcobacter bivalviorum]|uniref:Uncharacterized protein n=1 Tax=Halarcobacter bivalviorum TaxID=663364 RepID=A0AAX2A796_9BACT|nr:hypothetical protein [Halarcobacter bivalviorum]AXH11456.1 hypothetical protein ABIV_0435 [Halarcobacter bivalviorum]RXK09359.1 hypothetical protein CRV05_10545 [Halarcobacter bivalviorum]